MSSNYPELVFSNDEDFDADRINSAMTVLDSRLRAIEPFSPKWQDAVNELRLFGLARLNETIAPAYDRVLQLTEFGFLLADSDTSVTLAEGDVTFFIKEGAKRDLFTPAPFLSITREASATDYATAKLKSYDKDTGKLVLTIIAVFGNPGPFNDWWIGAMAGNALAAMQYLAQIDAARAAAQSARDVAVNNAAVTTSDRINTASDAASALASKNAAAASAAAAQTFEPSNYTTPDQVNAAITAAVNGLLNSAPAALDTLKELADALGNDASFSATVAAALGNRVRVDVNNQGLSGVQKANARTNIGLGLSDSVQFDNLKVTHAVNITGSDLNAVTDGGWYNGATLGNAPDTAWWYVEVIKHHNDNGHGLQRIWSFDGVRFFYRTQQSGTWGPWQSLANKAGDTFTGDVNVNGKLKVSSGGIWAYGWSADNNKGVVFLNAAETRYLHFDGVNYSMPGAPVVASNGRLWGAADFNIANYPVVDSIDAVGLSGAALSAPYIRRKSDWAICWLQPSTFTVNTWIPSSDGVNRIQFANGDRTIYNSNTSGWAHAFQQQGSDCWLMEGFGNFYAKGDLIAAWSDGRLKQDIETVEPNEGLSRTLSYRVVDYSWNEKGRELHGKTEDCRERGLIAQEAQAVNPQAAAENRLGTDENGDPYLTLKEEKIIFDLIGAVQAQQKMIDDLRAEIADLKAR